MIKLTLSEDSNRKEVDFPKLMQDKWGNIIFATGHSYMPHPKRNDLAIIGALLFVNNDKGFYTDDDLKVKVNVGGLHNYFDPKKFQDIPRGVKVILSNH